MNLFLTIDVETYTGDYGVDVYGRGMGLPFIIETLKKYNVKATFFVEAIGATRWGRDGVKRVCKDLINSGHDIQLHIHPKVAKIEGIQCVDDKLWKYDRNTQKKLIEMGLNILSDCGVKDVVAFRAGDLAVDETTLSVMDELGLHISSNRDLDNKSSIHTKINNFFPVKNDLSCVNNMWGLPVTAFKSRFPFVDGACRHFEICALGLKEMIAALKRMVHNGYLNATILTHPGEFYQDSGRRDLSVKKNCRRLDELLKFVSGNNDFGVTTVHLCVPENHLPISPPKDVNLIFFYSLHRMWEQIWWRLMN